MKENLQPAVKAFLQVLFLIAQDTRWEVLVPKQGRPIRLKLRATHNLYDPLEAARLWLEGDDVKTAGSSFHCPELAKLLEMVEHEPREIAYAIDAIREPRHYDPELRNEILKALQLRPEEIMHPKDDDVHVDITSLCKLPSQTEAQKSARKVVLHYEKRLIKAMQKPVLERFVTISVCDPNTDVDIPPVTPDEFQLKELDQLRTTGNAGLFQWASHLGFTSEGFADVLKRHAPQ